MGSTKKTSWLDEYEYKGVVDLVNLDTMSDQDITLYAEQAQFLDSNVVFHDVLNRLERKYQEQIIKKVQTIEELQLSRCWLKVIDELRNLVNYYKQASKIKSAKGGRQEPYLPM